MRLPTRIKRIAAARRLLFRLEPRAGQVGSSSTGPPLSKIQFTTASTLRRPAATARTASCSPAHGRRSESNPRDAASGSTYWRRINGDPGTNGFVEGADDRLNLKETAASARLCRLHDHVLGRLYKFVART